MAQDYAKWVPIYYADYTDKAAKAGVTPLDQKTWASTYYGVENGDTIGKNWSKVDPNFNEVNSKIGKELGKSLITQYNKSAQELASATGSTYIPYDGSTNFDDVYSATQNIKSQAVYESDRAYKQYVADAKAEGATPLSRADWTPGTAFEKPKYEFVMPTEWQTIEDMANATIQKGEPTLNTDLVNEWETKLEGSYAPVRDKLKKNMADYWAALFPQGGGSGKQAALNMGQLTDFETNKFNTALGFAQTDLANKLATFQQAQQKLADIGTFKAGADQFKSTSDAANYWNNISQNWNQSKYFNDILQSQKTYNQQAELAKYLAEISKPQQVDQTAQILNSLISGATSVGTAALLSSRDYKKEIKDSDIDSVSMIKGLAIKKYKYKGETKQRIGVIAEDTPDLLTTDNKKALDVVNLFGTILDAVKKLTMRIEALEAKNA